MALDVSRKGAYAMISECAAAAASKLLRLSCVQRAFRWCTSGKRKPK